MEKNLKRMIESLCCTPESNTSLQINYAPIKLFWKTSKKRDKINAVKDTQAYMKLQPMLITKKGISNQKSNTAAAAKSLQSCPTLCDPIYSSPPGSAIPGILQAMTLEWVAISFSNAWKWKVKVKLLSRVRLLATPWTAANQALPSMGFSRQEYWCGLPLPSPEKQYKHLNFSYLE